MHRSTFLPIQPAATLILSVDSGLAAMLWGVIVAAVVGALRHLMKRPYLTGDQKLVALLVSLVISVPVGGVLYILIAILVIGLMLGGFSVGEEALLSVVLLGPLVLIMGLGFFIAGNVENGREARRKSGARVATLNRDDC